MEFLMQSRPCEHSLACSQPVKPERFVVMVHLFYIAYETNEQRINLITLVDRWIFLFFHSARSVFPSHTAVIHASIKRPMSNHLAKLTETVTLAYGPLHHR